jgi:AcrR family transcriptional regulator
MDLHAPLPPDLSDAASSKGSRKPDAERTRRDILEVARAEFVEHGLAGARVDAIAARMRTTKRMIYYYFGSKEGLYLAVLEQAYADIRATEQTLHLSDLPPMEAIRRLVEFTFDYQESHPDFIRLVAIENIHHGRYLKQSEAIRGVNLAVIDTLRDILDRGRREGVFRSTVEPIDLHLLISACCFFRVANRHTFGALFDLDFSKSEVRDRHRRMIVDTVIRLLCAETP